MKLYYVTLNPQSGLQIEIEQAIRDRNWLNREIPNKEAQ
jgi:hypothetical protein